MLLKLVFNLITRLCEVGSLHNPADQHLTEAATRKPANGLPKVTPPLQWKLTWTLPQRALFSIQANYLYQIAPL